MALTKSTLGNESMELKRLDKLEYHVDTIYAKLSTQSESLARVESGQLSIQHILETLSEKQNQPPEKANILGWLGFSILGLASLGTIALLVIKPIEQTQAAHEESMSRIFTATLKEAENRGRILGEIKANKEIVVYLDKQRLRGENRIRELEIQLGEQKATMNSHIRTHQ